MTCAGSTPSTWSVDPAPGWSWSADLADDVLEVLFSSYSGQVLDVRATCPDGIPVFAPG